MSMRVLVVDDYPGAADVACVLVRLLGHEASAATTAAQALAAVESYHPHVIVLDLGLPDGTGYDVARAVRSRGGKQPFIAAMTGWDSSADRGQSLAAGIDMHVVKPASAENLGLILAAATSKVTDSGAASLT